MASARSAVRVLAAAVALLAAMAAAQTPSVTVLPTTLKFANVALGSSLNKKVTVTNNQSIMLLLSSPTLSGNSAFSVIGSTCKSQLAPAGSCTLQIAFTPVVM